MAQNGNLHKAKAEKNDEFYTQLSDIENELHHYKNHFNGKTIYCNCDDPYESNFVKYFLLNFNYLGLKRFIATCYAESKFKQSKTNLWFVQESVKEKKPYKIDISYVPEDIYTLEDVENKLLNKDNVKLLKENGDFRSEESIELLRQSDIVVTNPPFSLFREFIHLLVSENKKFLVIGNMNAITYKEIFPLIRNNELWLGYGFNLSMIFNSPYKNELESNRKYVKSKGYNPDDRYIKVPEIAWFTNLDTEKRHESLYLYKEYNEREYPKYDNYDAINVDKVVDIPKDYYGVMGVPITFLNKYNPDQFDIVAFRKGEDGKDLVFTRGGGEKIQPYFRVLIRRR